MSLLVLHAIYRHYFGGVLLIASIAASWLAVYGVYLAIKALFT